MVSRMVWHTVYGLVLPFFDSKGKKPFGSYRPGERGAISSFRQGAPRPQYASIQLHGTSYA